MIERPILPGVLVKPDKSVTFTFDGQKVRALEGQSIAAALYASGMRIFSRSHHGHRPRGLFCMSGDCPNCLMRVDGRDNVRTCVEQARDGQKVVHQHAWPSLSFDVSWLFDSFSRSRRQWLDAASLPQLASKQVEELKAQVCIIGGGPAGLSAAVELAAANLDVLIIERMPRLGGHLLFDGVAFPDLAPVIASLQNNPHVRIMTDTTAFDLSSKLLVGAYQGERFLKVQASQVIVCTGGRERPFVFHRNDLPGIMLCRGAQRLGRLYGVPPGRKAVVVTDHADGARMAEELVAYGVEIKAVVDPRPATWGTHIGRGWEAQSVLAGKSMSGMGGEPAGWSLQTSSIILEAQGANHLKAVKLAQLNPNGSITAKSERIVECDLLCVASSLTPANELMRLAGVRFQQKDGQWQPSKPLAGLAAAGAAAGTLDLAAQVLEGKLRGAEAADALGHTSPQLDRYRADWNAWLQKPRPKAFSSYFPYASEEAIHRFVCLCADVAQVEIELALVEGCENVEAVKNYAKVTRGPCQGRMCENACVELCTRRIGKKAIAEPGETEAEESPAQKPGQPRIPKDG